MIKRKSIITLIITAVVIASALVSCGKTGGIDYMVLVNKTHKLPEDWEEKLE